MPLFRYFIVVGLALIGLLYAVSAMLPGNVPRHISNNIDGVTSNNLESNRPARQQYTAPAVTSAPEPDMPSSAAVPAAAPPASASQKFNVPSARVAPGTPQNTTRNRATRKRVWRNDFRRHRGWRDPFWGSWR